MRRRAPLFGLVVICLVATLPCLPAARFYFLDDGFLHLFRLFEFDRVLRQGAIYPRWAPDFAYGYGYPVFNFYPPLAYYLAETLHILGLAIPGALIAAFIFILALGVAGAYALGAELFKATLTPHLSALLTAAAFVFFPYFLIDIFVRGAIAEALGAAVLPWLVWSLHRTIERRTLGSSLMTAVWVAISLVSHNLTLLLVAPFLVVFLVWETIHLPREARLGALAHLVVAGLLGGMTAAIYWLPTLTELSLVAISQEKKALMDLLQGSFLAPADLIQSALPYQYHDQPYPLGLLPMVLAAAALAALALMGRALKGRGTLFFFGAVGLLAIFFMLDAAKSIWLAVPFLSTVQFAWRTSVLINLCVAVLIGALPAVLSLRENLRGLAVALTVLLVALLAWNGLANLHMQGLDNPVGDLTTAQMARFEVNTRGLGFGSQSEYLPLSVKFVADRLPAAPVQGNAPGIHLEQASAARQVLDIAAERPATLFWRTFYFPGWQATIDGQPAATFASTALGLLTLSVPAGNHRIILSWEDTWPRRVGALLSALGTCALFGLAALAFRRREKELVALLVLLGSFLGIFLLTTSVALAAAPPALQSSTVDVSPEIRLLGLHIENANYDSATWKIAGAPDSLQLQVYWQVKQPLSNQPFVWRITDRAGHVWATHTQAARYGTGFPTAWIPDEIVQDEYDLPLAAGMPAGKFELQVAFGSSGQFVPASTLELLQGVLPAPVEPLMARRVDAHLGDHIRLLGADFPAVAHPGQAVPITLYWQAEADLPEDLTVFAQLLDADGKMVAQHDGMTADGFYPSMLWRPGEVVVDKRPILLPRSLEPGEYHLVAGLYRYGSMERLPVTTAAGPSPDDAVDLGTVLVPMDAQAARPEHASAISFGPAIRLTGYDLGVQDARGNVVAKGDDSQPSRLNARLGQTLALRLYWQCQVASPEELKVFVHILNQGGQIVAQEDSAPGRNKYPTRIWSAGEQVLDSHLLPLGLPPGRYRIVVGMYDATSGERLVAHANGASLPDRQVEVADLTVVASSP
ncbi:MAG: 6-pyruvoyl-tetrahydropterin synthase-related protein [Chloroflexi bacterium]|nr:6-pyruvoyl-tetrahydropterin synthase-related protein [Chloroflexota bacterium]